VSRRPDHHPGVLIEFQDRFLFPDYSYSSVEKPKATKKGSSSKTATTETPADASEEGISDEDVANLRSSIKGKGRKTSGAGGPFELVARGKSPGDPGSHPSGLMVTSAAETILKHVKIPPPKASGSADRNLLSPKSKKKALSLSESLERAKKRKLNIPEGAGEQLLSR
jgi:hypothetical protein